MHAMEKSSIAHRSWNILRLAVIRNKHGGIAMSLGVIGNLTRKLVHRRRRSRREARGGALAFGDREFSFDETPIFHVKMRRRDLWSSSSRFRMPCIRPRVDEDFSYREDGELDEEMNGDREIDFKAEEFIAKFYEHLRLQRQTSITRLKTVSFN